ncbi:MAG TPA: SMP-30/gluconolactonase/LRE family protein [Gammaproteobacteria bacterium]|nr:SMP-30/gluconolactonase/LRE family protein [Gammaproteobacteria bacterium]
MLGDLIAAGRGHSSKSMRLMHTLAAQLTVALVASLAVASSAAQPANPAPRPFRVVRADPKLDAVVSSDARLELIGDRFGLTEGPVWVPDGGDGYLLFSDLISNVIYRWAPGEPISVHLDRAGYSGNELTKAGFQTRRGRMAVLLVGPNGLSLDAEGRLLYLAANDRAVMRLERDGKRTVVADRYDDRRFNGPNDLAVHSNGAIYMTDSVWGLRDGLANPDSQLNFSGVYLIRGGKTTLLYSDADNPGGWPNGIALSPDERYLYMNTGVQNVLRYELAPDGTLRNRTVFIAGEGSDGMKVDTLGNLYTTNGAGAGEVRITSPEGVRLGVLELPVPAGEPQAQVCATNVAFGDRDSRTLYITACEHVYRIRMNVAGVHPAAARH